MHKDTRNVLLLFQHPTFVKFCDMGLRPTSSSDSFMFPGQTFILTSHNLYRHT